MDFAQTRERVEKFEQIIERARNELWSNDPPEVGEHFLQHDHILAWRLMDLLRAYQESRTYKQDRLPGVMDRLIDLKLQLYFVSHALPATVNAQVYLRGYSEGNPLDTPGLELARLCYTQAIINAGRILWERLMRLVYYLEMGEDMPRYGSSREHFFSKVPHWSPRWDFMSEWNEVVRRFDESFRHRETHRESVLAKELLGDEPVDPDRVLELLTPLMNGVWPALLANVQDQPHGIIRLGHNVSSFEERVDR